MCAGVGYLIGRYATPRKAGWFVFIVALTWSAGILAILKVLFIVLFGE